MQKRLLITTHSQLINTRISTQTPSKRHPCLQEKSTIQSPLLMASEAIAWRPASHLQSIRQLSGGKSLLFRLRLVIGLHINSTQIEGLYPIDVDRILCCSANRRMRLYLVELASNLLNAVD